LGQVLEYGFTVMQLNRIEAVVDPANAACLGLLRKVGFIEEGLLREYEHETKGYVDLVMLSLLKKDRHVSSG
jgi:[ribosomal protein S5]-alanine N-acetyltransferase